MSRKSYILGLACFIVMLSSTKSESRQVIHTIKIGETCERDYQCIKHAFCRSQMTCLCDSFYAPSLDKATCHVTAGAACHSQEKCETMTNAECRQNVCTCKDDFMIDMNNSSNCIMRPKAPGDLCQRNDDCTDSMEKAVCINEKCMCFKDFRFVNETGTCIKPRGLYQPCKWDYECFLDEKHPNALECKERECACRKDKCVNGSPMFEPFFMIFATLAVGTTFRTFI